MSALAAVSTASVGAAQTAPPAPPAPAMSPGMPISPDLITRAEALNLAQRSIVACEARGETASVFVTDADGNLRAALSSDKGVPIGLSSATRKTAAVFAFHASTRDLQARLKTDPAFAEQFGKDPRYYYSPGGLPIYKAGKFVAVIAVGGGHALDETCALDALKALSWASTKP